MEEDATPPMRGLDDQEESVRIAVKALGDMRNMSSGGRSKSTAQPVVILPPLSISSSSTTSNSDNNSPSRPLESAASSSTSNSEPTATSPFVSRMSSFPLVGSALRVYEQGKASSRVVKYGAEMVESSVKSISKPVIDRLPVNVNQLDEFACRQLDRLDRYRRPSTSGENPNANANPSPSSPTTATPTSASGTLTSTTTTTSTTNSNPNPNPNPNPNAPSLSERDRGRPKLRTKTLDGSALDDRDEDEVSSIGGESSGYRMHLRGPIVTTSEDGSLSLSLRRERGVREREWERERRGGGGGGGGGGRSVPKWLEATSPFVAPPPPPPDSRGSSPTRDGDRSERSYSFSHPSNKSEAKPGMGMGMMIASGASVAGSNTNTNTSEGGSERQVAQRSRWQAMLLEAGGLSAALSEENMRRLKYCLQWLQYATAHIDAQILILRDFTASLQIPPASPTGSSSSAHRPARPPISEEHMRKLTDVRRDIVHTIRQVVDVVSKYAGGALPEPARGRVRGFILKLPQRWATRAGGAGEPGGGGGGGEGEREREQNRERVAHSATAAAAGSGTGVVRRPGGQRRAAQRERGVDAGNGVGNGHYSGASSRAVSPSSSPRVGRAVLGGGHEGAGGSGQVSANAALLASQRILTLATESLDMVRNVTSVVKDSLDRADAWVGRLRTVGIQRGESEDGASTYGMPRSPTMSASAHSTTTRDRQQQEGGEEAFAFEFSDRMRYRHVRNGSAQSTLSQLDDERDMDLDIENDRDRDHHHHHHRQRYPRRGPEVEMDGEDQDGVRSPFFSAASSTAWGSSIPSTPGGSSSNMNLLNSSSSVFGPGSPSISGSGGSRYNNDNNNNATTPSRIQVHSPSGSGGGSVGNIPIGKMTLHSRYGTPKTGVVGLPKEEEEEDVKRVNMKLREIVGGRGGGGYDDDGDLDLDVKVRRKEEEEEEEEGMDVDVDVDVGAHRAVLVGV